MSRIFDVLHRSRVGRSGLGTIRVPSGPIESLENVRPEPPPIPPLATTLTCYSCRYPIPESAIFCPKCDAFLGSVVTERQGNDALEPQKSKGTRERRSTGLRGLWLRIRH